MTTNDLPDLSDRAVLLTLQELAEEIVHTERDSAPQDVGEAELLIDQLARHAGLTPPAHADLLANRDDSDLLPIARLLLQHLLHDDDTASIAQAVLADPPADEQLSVDAAASAAVILGALTAWLQTKVHIKVRRQNGETEFEFQLIKNHTAPGTIRKLASAVVELLKGLPPSQ
ncbi:hypothetical protein [Nocardia arizonensis]|uniref:hypothetical protein n=1 Tax=Nocardia arizonensis TaxID=1141647 RepID=UPI0006D27F1F|nr:hypothetical protein [Nocardia arizonensis]